MLVTACMGLKPVPCVRMGRLTARWCVDRWLLGGQDLEKSWGSAEGGPLNCDCSASQRDGR